MWTEAGPYVTWLCRQTHRMVYQHQAHGGGELGTSSTEPEGQVIYIGNRIEEFIDM
ncbi:hypothetical protein DPMN_062312 [Dreissena polymorpha]|uniref:Uncharacterized protein n=1 Tax=Dreissena polymorpha TaxID=45954 RepID=A0A9D4C9I5_DREPO|nr:hypothetical protein DPMN_062312 [Dreissena polymorpha]